jgi:hypothetical protein
VLLPDISSILCISATNVILIPVMELASAANDYAELSCMEVQVSDFSVKCAVFLCSD